MSLPISSVLIILTIGQSICVAAVPKSLQGKWILVEVHQQDRVAKISHQNSGCTIDEESLTLQAGEIRQRYELQANPSTTPPEITTSLRTENGLQVSQGIYHVTGRRLRMCFSLPGNPRPEGFSAHVGEPHFMWVFERPIEKPPFTESAELTPGQQNILKRASDELQGVWKIVSMEWDGRQFPGKVSGKIIIRGDKATSYGGKEPVTYSLEIAPQQKPARLNLLKNVNGELKIKRCIYKIEGDTLTLCHHFKSNQARPAQFETRASDGLLLTRLKRERIRHTGQ